MCILISLEKLTEILSSSLNSPQILLTQLHVLIHPPLLLSLPHFADNILRQQILDASSFRGP